MGYIQQIESKLLPKKPCSLPDEQWTTIRIHKDTYNTLKALTALEQVQFCDFSINPQRVLDYTLKEMLIQLYPKHDMALRLLASFNRNLTGFCAGSILERICKWSHAETLNASIFLSILTIHFLSHSPTIGSTLTITDAIKERIDKALDNLLDGKIPKNPNKLIGSAIDAIFASWQENRRKRGIKDEEPLGYIPARAGDRWHKQL